MNDKSHFCDEFGNFNCLDISAAVQIIECVFNVMDNNEYINVWGDQNIL